MQENQRSQAEKTVSLDDVDNETADQMLKSQPAIGNVKSAVPKYKNVTDYTTFRAEYGMVGDDIVIHFFETAEKPITLRDYWQVLFPRVLNDTGQEYFQAGHPRLVAKFTPELKSWWFRARGYDHLLDPDAFVAKFLEKLDSTLDQAVQ
jgi:hypothetical protein